MTSMTDPLKIVVVGDKGVGKKTLAKQFLNMGDISSDFEDIGMADGKVGNTDVSFFVAFPPDDGSDPEHTALLSYTVNAKVCLFCINPNEDVGQQVQSFKKICEEKLKEQGTVVIPVFTHADQKQPSQQDRGLVTDALSELQTKPTQFVSSQTEDGIDALREMLTTLINTIVGEEIQAIKLSRGPSFFERHEKQVTVSKSLLALGLYLATICTKGDVQLGLGISLVIGVAVWASRHKSDVQKQSSYKRMVAEIADETSSPDDSGADTPFERSESPLV